MAIRIVQLGSPRETDEGLRIGTVRRPPRGVPKRLHAKHDWYDVWLAELAPSAELLREARSEQDDGESFRRFAKRYRAEMKGSENSRLIDLLAALSHHANFSVSCYCEREKRCHRSILRELLLERGAKVV
ncbi:MAG: DUF488 domain-containing protein [Ignavibacteriales bacterium]